MSLPDPFGTAALRASTLQTWRSSPTRLREDTATEADLVRGGYRDRVLTELAQNAADAAARAGVPGELHVQLSDGALRVANTGAPLDAEGVAALAALRASSKTTGVGRFGVGFTAVLAVSDEPRVLSRSGSVAFSGARTRAELGVTGPVPVLRLVWPIDAQPAAGYDTEVVLALRAGVDGSALLVELAAQAPQLLLELTALQRVTVGARSFERTERALAPRLSEVRVDGGTWWQATGARARWLVRLEHGEVLANDADVLRAPTRTDEELSLPAVLVAHVELAPDRRRVLPGACLDGLADGYPQLVAALAPEQRTRLVPLPGFPRSAVDAVLRTQVLTALTAHPWLPSAAGPDVTPSSAVLLERATPELVDLLAGALPGLLVAEYSAQVHTPALTALDVERLGLAALADAVAGLGREPSWWRQLYAALDPLVHDRAALQELAALAVPLVDGRTVLGPRTAVLLEGAGSAGAVAAVPGLRVVHPDAAHPLLVRLGAAQSGATELLEDPVLQQAVAAADPEDRSATGELADAVLRLVAAAGARAGEHPWLGGLLLADATGQLRAADELLLPDAPLAALLVADAPFGTVAQRLLDAHGPDVLRATGVGWGFTVLDDPDATAPEHDLDDEYTWWGQTQPSRVLAVRDLELVDDAAWAQALTLLHAEPETLAALREPGGHTPWWLRRHARLHGQPLGHWRSPDQLTFAGLLDPVAVAGLSATVLAPAVVDSPELARLLLQRLAEEARHPSPAVVAGVHAALAAALEQDVLELDDVAAPDRVRAADGSVIRAQTALVLDAPWLAGVLPAARLVLGALGDGATALAELLDLALASDEVAGQVVSAGTVRAFTGEPSVVLACAQLDVAVPEGTWVRHEVLRVRVGATVHTEHTVHTEQTVHTVPWWVDDTGRPHADAAGLLAALLHVLGPSR